eukprot:GFUD01005282.1.p1 GENE.GFUD01005282.1~~GFUD01005282.1.p1  ORF type:complete len:351 (-),score=116.66 GFUD01005282.1:309-1361(-)
MTSSPNKAARRVSISVETSSQVYEQPDIDEEYSASEYSGRFTVVTPNTSMNITSVNDDTDIEADVGFNDYSEVTFDQKYNIPDKATKQIEKLKPLKKKTGAVSTTSKPPSCLQSTRCSTQCASTYRNHRSRRKTLSALSGEKQTDLKKSAGSDSDENYKASPIGRRKTSKFGDESSPEKKLIEGTFKHSSSINYEEYLAAIGTGPCSQDLVMRAGMVLRIKQEPDKQWRISTETLIRAKSVRGYRTNNRKWTENKFKVGERKPELLDDWDQRLVVTILEVKEEGNRMTLKQVAEKDQVFAKDSVVELEVDQEEPDILIMTCKAGEVVAWRKFERQVVNSKFSDRKSSSPF